MLGVCGAQDLGMLRPRVAIPASAMPVAWCIGGRQGAETLPTRTLCGDLSITARATVTALVCVCVCVCVCACVHACRRISIDLQYHVYDQQHLEPPCRKSRWSVGPAAQGQ